MARSLLLAFLAVILFCGAPAAAQYLYFDTNHNQICDPMDYVWGTDVPVDVYLDTSHNLGGGPATCPTGELLSMTSYELIFGASPEAPVIYGAWTNAIAAFGLDLGRVQSGNYLWVGFSGSMVPPGLYKLGTLILTAPPCTFVTLTYSMPGAPDYFSGFTSSCVGASQDNTLKLGRDFSDFCMGATICDDTRKTTWGVIKNLYR